MGEFGGNIYVIILIWGRYRWQNSTFYSSNMFGLLNVSHTSIKLIKYRGKGEPEKGLVQVEGT